MKKFSQKICSRPIVMLFILMMAIGIICRLAFIIDVGTKPLLNVNMRGSDLFTYDLQAKNLALGRPLKIEIVSYPLFVLFLKTIYQYIGTSSFIIYSIYFMLSMLSVAFLMMTGAVFFGIIPGILAGLFMLFYRMNYLYDALLSHTALSQFLIIISLFFFSRYSKTPKGLYYTGFIVFGALLSLFRPFFALIIIPGAICLIWNHKQYTKPAYVMLTIIICFLSIFLFSHYRSQKPYTHQFGIHFYIGNHADSNGLLVPLPGIRPNAEGFAVDSILRAHQATHRMGSSDHYWIAKTFDSYRGRPLNFLKLLHRKIQLLTNNFEPHNLTSVYYYEHATLLGRLPRINFAVIFSLAMAGIFLIIKRKHPATIFFVPMIIIIIMILSVFLCARYRMPLIPFLCLFAGYGLMETIQALIKKKLKLFISLVIIIISTLIWSNFTIDDLDKKYDVAFWQSRENIKMAFFQKRHEALSALNEWERLKPNNAIRLMDNLGKIGLYHEFFEYYDRAMALAPNHDQHQITLLRRKAIIYEDIHNYKNAIKTWNELKTFNPIKPEAERRIKNLLIIGPILEKDFFEEP